LIFNLILVTLKVSDLNQKLKIFKAAENRTMYDHTNSDNQGGDSMNQPASSDHSPSASQGPKPSPARPASPTTSPSKLHRCSYCGATFERSQTKHMPFCSKRCQEIDLGMWLNESYGFPFEGDATSENYGISADDQDA
jgi:endogenous inhibitor of DNA gyrase (YacG/DUF329 family)